MPALEKHHSDCKAAVVSAAVGGGIPAAPDLLQPPVLLQFCSLPWLRTPRKRGDHLHAPSTASALQMGVAAEDEPPVVS